MMIPLSLAALPPGALSTLLAGIVGLLVALISLAVTARRQPKPRMTISLWGFYGIQPGTLLTLESGLPYAAPEVVVVVAILPERGYICGMCYPLPGAPYPIAYRLPLTY